MCGLDTEGTQIRNVGLESERRQISFGAAIGIPTFFVREDTPNKLLARLVKASAGTRRSHRYPGRIRVVHAKFQMALVEALERDAADLIQAMGLEETMADLRARLTDPSGASAAGKLTKGALARVGAKKPLKVPAREFNASAEAFYRDELRRKHLFESLRAFRGG